jgi:catechol 2,3-dioxygenase-like lactoylglutathione lyase family enzyme
VITYDGVPTYSVSATEFADDLVTHETQYSPTPSGACLAGGAIRADPGPRPINSGRELVPLPGPWRYKMPEGNQPGYEIALAHFIVSDDVERSRRFYTEVLGGKTIRSGEPTYVALANSWIIINVGGGPTDDKPAVTLETPRDPDLASGFLNIRVSDIHAVYAEWSARGAEFLTPPKQHKTELRCYMRDPDGYLIEVGQTTLPGGWRQFLNP